MGTGEFLTNGGGNDDDLEQFVQKVGLSNGKQSGDGRGIGNDDHQAGRNSMARRSSASSSMP